MWRLIVSIPDPYLLWSGSKLFAKAICRWYQQAEFRGSTALERSSNLTPQVTVPRLYSFVDPFYLCFMFVFVILSCLFFAALWSPAGEKGWPLGSLVCDVFLCQVWHLMVLIPDLCLFCFFCCLLILSKNSFRVNINVSLNPDQDRHSGSKLFAKVVSRRQMLPH